MKNKKTLLLLSILLLLVLLSGCGGKEVTDKGSVEQPQKQDVVSIEYAELQELEMPWSPVKGEQKGLQILREYVTDKAIVYPTNEEKKAVSVSYPSNGFENVDVNEVEAKYKNKMLSIDENRYISYTDADDAPSGLLGNKKTLTLVDVKNNTKKKLATQDRVTRPGNLTGVVDIGKEKVALWLETRLERDECDHLYICGMGLDSGTVYEYPIADGFYSGEIVIGDSRVFGDQIWVFYSNNARTDSSGMAKGSTNTVLVLQLKESGFEQLAEKFELSSAGTAIFLPDPEQKGVLFCKTKVNRDNPQIREWRHIIKFGRWELRQ